MKNFLHVLIVISILGIATTGCYYDKEEILYPQNECDTADVKYSAQITYIISNNCYDCHSNTAAPISGGGQSFEGYANISGYLTTSAITLISSINHSVGFTPMPKDRPKLSECDIRTIEIWIENGFPNN